MSVSRLDVANPGGVEAVIDRITAIQARLASLSPPAQAPAPAGKASTPVGLSPPGGAGSVSDAVAGLLAGVGGPFADRFSAAVASLAGEAAAGGAQALGGDAALTPSRRPGAGPYPPVPIPAEYRQHGNGKLPDALLSPIGHGGHKLNPAAAAAFRQLERAAQAEGVELGVTDSYRTYASQVDLAERKGLYSNGGLAARPGTSNHGWGFALDLDLDAKGQAWMRQNGWRFGFVEDTPREPWHWTYRPDPSASAPAATR